LTTPLEIQLISEGKKSLLNIKSSKGFQELLKNGPLLLEVHLADDPKIGLQGQLYSSKSSTF
jgi:hypothetical protein